jgi:glyoxalase family protein
MMHTTVHGIHHVTAVAGDAQQNLDFYVGVLGMRMVKKTVNQDAPHIYHLFYADGAGTPGTDITFFPWPDIAPTPGQIGIGLTVEVPFAIAQGSMSYWRERLAALGVQHSEIEIRFGEPTLPFSDPDGLRLALVETAAPRLVVPWKASPVPAQHQVRGMHYVRMWQRELAPTQQVLTAQMGFKLLGIEAGWHRYGVEGGGSGKLVDVKELPSERRGVVGAGTVHHVAWRVNDDREEMALHAAVETAGLRPTPQIDRFWFRSVYFKEPGGALFELATDGPGFDRDEDPAHLGEQLILAPWLEQRRAEIEAVLAPLELPKMGIGE